MILSQFQQLKLASLGRLSASIAHEIRNPLGAISHAVQLIQESDQLTPEDRSLSEVALRQSARIDRIINDVLQVSNRAPATRHRINLAETFASFRQRFLDERGLKQTRFQCDCADDVIAIVDADQLDQILWNLCGNALLHNCDTAVGITLKASANTSGTVAIDVIDSGKGLGPTQAAQLFEPFYSTNDQGSGLGLYIVRELCHANNGMIECLPSDQGAHFRITLPGTSEPL